MSSEEDKKRLRKIGTSLLELGFSEISLDPYINEVVRPRLPPGWQIEIAIEYESVSVSLLDPDDCIIEVYGEGTLVDRINAALASAGRINSSGGDVL